MGSRYVINTVALVAAGFLVVVSRTFGATPLEWVGFGIGAGVLLASVLGAVLEPRSWTALGGYAITGTLGLWTLISALVFTGSGSAWLLFADALGIVAAALAALAAHEISSERVVHTLEVRNHEVRVA